MKRSEHAKEIAQRFRELVETAGDSLPEQHYDELTLLIEAGIDSALVDKLETIADKLGDISRSIRHDAEFFD